MAFTAGLLTAVLLDTSDLVTPMIILDDTYVSRHMTRKSHTFACDFAECNCFGKGTLKCSQCTSCVHDECARKANCVFLDGFLYELLCGEYAAVNGLQNVAEVETVCMSMTYKFSAIR